MNKKDNKLKKQVAKQISKDLVSDLKPMISGFLEYINSISFTLDEEGSLTITKPNDLTLFKKKRDKNE